MNKNVIDRQNIIAHLKKLSTDDTLQIWNCQGLEIYYYNELDGGGRFLAEPYIQFIKGRYKEQDYPETIFEWCSGPAFIGFALLEAGLCKHLYLADINPKAIECINMTVEKNSLADSVTFVISDNLHSLPLSAKFDLVVSNPPNYYAINPAHDFFDLFKDDIKPNDPGWSIHKDFYNSIENYLNPDGRLYISEVEPFKQEVMIPLDYPVPFDIRPRPPVDDFKAMIEEGGLRFTGAEYFASIDGVVGQWLMMSEKLKKQLH